MAIVAVSGRRSRVRRRSSSIMDKVWHVRVMASASWGEDGSWVREERRREREVRLKRRRLSAQDA